jgi:calcineurin-binding protein cabin-1
MPESSRKFITCIRKYILLYLVLCERTGDFYTLERAYSSIRIDKKVSLKMLRFQA